MKHHFITRPPSSKSPIGQPFSHLLAIAALSVLSLSACNQANDQPATADSAATQETTSSANTEAAKPVPVTTEQTPDVKVVDTEAAPKPEVEVIEVDDTQATPAAKTPTPPPQPDPEVAIVGTQISNVDYKSNKGETLKVVYETSVSGELKATATLPSGKTVTLNAPAGQGNNPTYRSADGSIEIVSHGGGGSIDLVQGGKPIGFDAVSTDAEVIPQ